MEYVERLLEEDIRNNSAWNQRMFVLSHTVQKVTGEILDRELKFAMNAITKVPGNESSWNYLAGYVLKNLRFLSFMLLLNLLVSTWGVGIGV